MQVEQDLIISGALCDLFSAPALKGRIAFRGGTAINKLLFTQPLRYSEDIDLVQVAVLKFCDTITASDDFRKSFKSATANTFESHAAACVHTMLDLLKAGVERDEHTLADDLLQSVEALILRVLERSPFEEVSRQSNPVSTALNSTRGRSISALILYTLRSSRLADRTEVGAATRPVGHGRYSG